MLRELRISNFAIIDQQSISFEAGLNVLSGETGAGKSIILGALQLILGAKSKSEMIRAGAEELEVEALLDLSVITDQIRSDLPDCAKGDELLISRNLNLAGRSKVYLNGRLSTVNLLQEISQKLINVCGQRHAIRLLDSAYHLQLIDSFIGNNQQLQNYSSAFKEWRLCQRQLQEWETSRKALQARIEQAQEIILDLKDLGVRAGMRDELEGEIKRLAGAEQLASILTEVCEEFDQPHGILRQLSNLNAHLSEAARIDQRLQVLLDRLHGLRTEFVELEGDLRRHVSRVEVNDRKLNELRDRLADICRFERKYRSDSAGLQRILAEAQQQVAEINFEDQRHSLSAAVKDARIKVDQTGQALSETRRHGCKALGKQLEIELADLGMFAAKLEAHITQEIEPTDCGLRV